MKRLFFFAAAAVILSVNIGAQTAITIPVKDSFRLNPIIGIIGDSHDADSRFVQRMLFSPLVMPMTDPVIDYAFEYDIAVSMISDVYVEKRRGWEREFDLYSPDDTTTWIKFKVTLRNELYFMNGTSKGEKITVSDVVFSYRTAQATLSLNRDGNTYTNAILRAQLADMESVDIDPDDANGVVFVFRSDRTTKSFIRFLNFAPILSEKQLTGKTNNQARGYVFGKNSSSDRLYDMRVMTGIRDFETKPQGYGQYNVENTITPSNNNPPFLAEEVRILKNPNWMPLGTPIVLANQSMGRHLDYVNNRDRYIIKKEGLNITSILGRDVFLINHTLNVSQFTSNRGSLERRLDDIQTERMYISSRLYGIFFSPGKNSTMFNDTRIKKFFNDCVNREMMANIIKNDADTLNAAVNVHKFLSKIDAYAMYYPFFGGLFSGTERTDEPGDLSELNDYLKTMDLSYSTYKTLSADIERYQDSDNQKKLLMVGYFRGQLWNDYLAAIKEKFVALQREIRIEEKMKDRDGNITIRILYDNEDDVALKLYNLVQQNLNNIFKYLTDEGIIKSRVQIRGERLNKRNIKSLYDQYDLVIYGWNYRFDFMSDIGDFILNDTAAGILKETYGKYLSSVQDNAVTEKLMFDIANQILNNQMLITMLGVQNYILWDKTRITMSSLPHLGQYIIMFPYYWRKNSEVR